MKTNRKTKILFILPNLNFGGAERVTINIIRSLNTKQYAISLILVDKVGNLIDLVPKNTKTINLDIKKTRYSFFRYIQVVNNLKPDIIFSSTRRTNMLILISSIFILRKSKIVIREPNSPYAQDIFKKYSKIYTKIIGLFYRRAKVIIAQSKVMKTEIYRAYRIPLNKIQVYPNKVDYKFIDKQTKGISNPYYYGYYNIVASGRICEQKGFDFLIKSIKRVVKVNEKVRLYIVGDDTNIYYKQSLLSLIKDLDLENYVYFLGFKKNPYPFYKFADLFVLSSRWEGFPNVVLESLYLKTPVVVTDCVEDFKEIIDEGKNGFVTKVGDEIQMAQKIIDSRILKISQKMIQNIDYNKIFMNIMY